MPVFYAGQLDYIDKLNKVSADASKTDINATVGGTTTLDCSLGSNFYVTMGTGSTTIAFSNVPTDIQGFKVTVYIVQDSVGSRTVTWPASISWPAGTAPTLTTTGSRVDIFEFRTLNNGTRFFGRTIGQNYVA